MADLYGSVSAFKDSQAQAVKEYSGILGLPTSNRTVSVPNRNGYVYVRLRDNQNEVIQAYNDEVSAVYNLPVIIVRYGGGWRIKGRDIERYSDWGTDSAFIPAHAAQHEFNRDLLGGDIVYIYSDAFIPWAVTPSGTGADNVIVQPMSFRHADGTWLYVGNTGTSSLLTYKPTNNQALMGLVYLDRDTGNPGFLINSGSLFSENITGSAAILSYLPTIPTDTYEPLYGVRLVSGTQTIQYTNLYDLRQFYSGRATGSGGGGIEEAPIDGLVYGRKNAAWIEVSGTAGGSTSPGGSDTNVQYNVSGTFGGSDRFTYDYDNAVLVVGDGNQPFVAGANAFHLIADNASPGELLWGVGNSPAVVPFIAGLKGRGTNASPTAIQDADVLFRVRGRGYNGVNWTSTQTQMQFDVPYAWVSGSHPANISLWATPSGTAIMEEVLDITPDGPNIINATTYNIGGSPHTHVTSEVEVNRDTGSAAQTMVTGTYTKVQFDTIVTDLLGEFDNSVNYDFTATESGFYNVAANVLTGLYTWAAAEILQMAIYKNGAIFVSLYRSIREASVAGYILFAGSTMLTLSAGDNIDIRIYNGHSTNINLYQSSAGTRLTVFRLG